MVKRKVISSKKEIEIQKERNMKVYKADELLQKGRFTLSVTEQRLILYTISKIKPSDVVFQEYEFKLSEFMKICGTNNHDSYTNIKEVCKKLSDKSWWLMTGDPEKKGDQWESLVRWFVTLRTNKKTDKIKVMFHPDMLPYLLELSRQREENKGFYSHYEFRYILPMKSQYSIRLYELLKTYQKNNQTWWFKFDDLRHRLDCDKYNFKDFRCRSLEPAINEINKFTDLKIRYKTEKEGKRIDIITFHMIEKCLEERIQAQKDGLTVLDGKVHYWDSDVLPNQTNLFGDEDSIDENS